jgi:hypothetical protein
MKTNTLPRLRSGGRDAHERHLRQRTDARIALSCGRFISVDAASPLPGVASFSIGEA